MGTIEGTTEVTTTDCVLHVVGILHIERTVDVVQFYDYNEVMIPEGKIIIAYCGKLPTFSGMYGEFDLDAAVMHTSNKGSYIALQGYYARLNDALEDAKPNSIIILLKVTSNFDSLFVPKDVQLVIPANRKRMFDIDALLNMDGALTVEDADSIIGDTMGSVWFGENALLSGDILLAQSNFYNGEAKATAGLGTNYRWVPINGTLEGWRKA